MTSSITSWHLSSSLITATGSHLRICLSVCNIVSSWELRTAEAGNEDFGALNSLIPPPPLFRCPSPPSSFPFLIFSSIIGFEGNSRHRQTPKNADTGRDFASCRIAKLNESFHWILQHFGLTAIFAVSLQVSTLWNLWSCWCGQQIAETRTVLAPQWLLSVRRSFSLRFFFKVKIHNADVVFTYLLFIWLAVCFASRGRRALFRNRQL